MKSDCLCRSLKVETIEKKVVVGSAVKKHGFVFDYQNGNASSRQLLRSNICLYTTYPFLFSICIFCMNSFIQITWVDM